MSPLTAVSAPVAIVLPVGGAPRLTAPDVAGAVLAAATRLAVLGQWDRVKICPAEDCRWAFYDRSRNHSRTWCSMQVCGNREKARAWRRRSESEDELGDRVDQ
jgi:predicted RNA-binding Zn ribbon-like protein